jgi:hypothetical protein
MSSWKMVFVDKFGLREPSRNCGRGLAFSPDQEQDRLGPDTVSKSYTIIFAIRSAAASFTWSVHITKQGTPKFTTEAHYILANISLKFRAQITKFQGDVP